jgi:hypothetical protein
MEKRWFTITYYTTVVEGGGFEEWELKKGKHKRFVQSESLESVSDLVNMEFDSNKLVQVGIKQQYFLNPKVIESISISDGKS